MRDPGPGPKYYLPSTIGLNKHDPTIRTDPGYSISGRYNQKYEAGPGPYYVESGLNNRGKINNGGFTLAGRPRQSFWERGSRDDHPKTRYDVNMSAVEPSSPRYSFGAPRKTNYKTVGPGPIYNIPSTIGKGPAATIYGRNLRQSFHYDYNKTPGPAYDTPRNQSKGFIIGRRTQLPGNKLITPGPIYNPSFNGNSPRSPGYTMGVRHHEEVITLADVSD